MPELSLMDTLDLLLDKRPITPHRFAEIVVRLYASGIILRDDNKVQERLYDDAYAVREILEDYFNLAGFRLQHNETFTYFRLYPPVPDGEEEESKEKSSQLSQSFTGDFPAYLLILRHLYQQALEGGGLEPDGAIVPMEEVHRCFPLLLNRELPGKTARKSALMELRSQKLVRLPEGFEAEPDDMLIAIRPTILDFVTPSQLLAVRAATQAAKTGKGGNGASDASAPPQSDAASPASPALN